jgi:hypothetical protein
MLICYFHLGIYDEEEDLMFAIKPKGAPSFPS